MKICSATLSVLWLVLFATAGMSSAGVIGTMDQFDAYLALNSGPSLHSASYAGQVVIRSVPDTLNVGELWHWAVPGIDAPESLPTDAEAEAVLTARALNSEAARQDAKPATLKALENDFFAFVRLVLTAAGDPRAADTPTPKLGFEELTPMIEGIQAADPMAAVGLTLKGLSIDSALKRYSPVWWDDAAEHEME